MAAGAHAETEFRRELMANPTREVRVLASFRSARAASEVVKEALEQGLSIEGFRHEDAAGSGGYFMKVGETVQEALANYDRDRKLFAARQIDELALAADRSAEPHIRAALEADIQKLKERQKRFETVPLMIVGVDLRGPAQSLSSFRQRHAYVRVLEIREATRINAAIRPQD